MASASSSACKIEKKKLNDSVYELRKPGGKAEVQIIFFHSLQYGDFEDEHLRTWMSRSGSECWPQTWLPDDFPEAHILSIDYDGSVRQTRRRGRGDLTVIGECLVEDIIHSREKIGQNEPVVLVGHGLGGIVIKQFLMTAEKMSQVDRDSRRRFALENFLKNVKGMLFYSTPHGGISNLADLVQGFISRSKPGPVVELLKIWNVEAARLNEDFRKTRERHGWRAVGLVESDETKLQTIRPAFCQVVVSEASARRDVDIFYTVPRTDHFTICQPTDKSSSSYQRLTELVQWALNKVQKEEPNHQANGSLPIGLRYPAERVSRMLENARTVGIVGMCGIGKTTLLEKLVVDLRCTFQMTCFVRDVGGLMRDCTDERQLEQHLWKAICTNITSATGSQLSSDMAVDALRTKRFLVVLDNVGSISEDLLLAIQAITLHNDSRMIVASSNMSVSKYKTCCTLIYKMPCLSHRDSRRLLVHYAFRGEKIPENISQYVDDVVEKCEGLPLALKIAGGHLRNSGATNVMLWADLLKCFQEGRDLIDNLLDMLRRSYDQLKAPVQKMFLDVAMLFHGAPVALVKQVWDASWGCGETGWATLENQCLVEEREGKVWMHGQVCNVGRSIACPADQSPENWTHICDTETATSLLSEQNNNGPVKAVGLRFVSKGAHDRFLVIRKGAFHRFRKLRYLLLINVSITEGVVVDLPKDLAYVRWEQDALKDLPCLRCRGAGFPTGSLNLQGLKKLGALEMRRCVVPTGLRELVNLTWLDLEDSKVHPPDLSGATKLKLLNLSGASVTELPESFGKLTELVNLQARCPGLTRIPESMTTLPMLNRLDLSHSGLLVLPGSIGCLANLEHLNLARTDKLSSLPDSIGMLQMLKELYLDRSGVTALPESLGSLANLQVLSLNATGKLCSLPDSLGRMHNLEHLELRCSSVSALPETFGDLSGLEHLDLSKSKVCSLPESFGGLRSLRGLYMNGCTQVCSLPESFGGLRSLRGLHMNRCTSLSELPTSFGNLAKLQNWEMRDCTLLHSLPETLGGLESLEDLYLEGSGVSVLPESIGEVRRLRYLNLEATPLKTLPESVGRLKSLWILKLNGSGVSVLPESIGELRGLEILELAATPLKTLPESVGGLESLEYLTLRGSGVSVLPESIGELRKLSRLELDGTPLKTLPEAVSGLESLEYLTLRGSGVSVLPESMGKLRNLKDLSLDATPLETLPQSVGRLKSLYHLKLSGSGVSVLPESIGELPCLLSLDLGATPLKTLPESVGGLESLVRLNLFGSGVSVLPESMGKLRNLEDLFLGGTPLKRLPRTMGKLERLRVLNLTNTPLTVVPDMIGGMKNLEDLHLGGSSLRLFPEFLRRLPNLKRLGLFGHAESGSLWAECDKLSSLCRGVEDMPTLTYMVVDVVVGPGHVTREITWRSDVPFDWGDFSCFDRRHGNAVVLGFGEHIPTYIQEISLALSIGEEVHTKEGRQQPTL